LLLFLGFLVALNKRLIKNAQIRQDKQRRERRI